MQNYLTFYLEILFNDYIFDSTIKHNNKWTYSFDGAEIYSLRKTILEKI